MSKSPIAPSNESIETTLPSSDAPVSSPASTTPTPTGPLLELQAQSNPIGEQSQPHELVAWGLQKFADLPTVLTTSFGMEGCALMDMCSKAIEQHGLPKLTIACIDTGFFFPETLQLREKLIKRYQNLEFVTWQTPVSIKEQADTYGDQLWKNNPNMCCNIRKVQPMQENIHRYRVWITALRRSQTEQRSTVPALGWDWKYQLLKLCPLVSWTRPNVWHYIQENDVPFNQLHLQDYPSISCYHCTKPVPGSTPEQEVRDGRWAGKDKTECGLHYSI